MVTSISFTDAIKVAMQNGYTLEFKGSDMTIRSGGYYDRTPIPCDSDTLFRFMFKLKRENEPRSVFMINEDKGEGGDSENN